MSPFRDHVTKWQDCTGCALAERRNRVVLARGKLPCDALFVGEAPGNSENIHGQPFIGPAGKLLDQMIAQAQELAETDLRIAFTNTVACIPIGAEGSKEGEPPKWAIKACQDRLSEMLDIAKPKLVVLVGKLAEKYTPTSDQWRTRAITHPAAILRADQAIQGITIQRIVVALKTAFGEL